MDDPINIPVMSDVFVTLMVKLLIYEDGKYLIDNHEGIEEFPTLALSTNHNILGLIHSYLRQRHITCSDFSLVHIEEISAPDKARIVQVYVACNDAIIEHGEDICWVPVSELKARSIGPPRLAYALGKGLAVEPFSFRRDSKKPLRGTPVQKWFDLRSLPRQLEEKRKVIATLSAQFASQKTYSQDEVDQIITKYFDEYTTVRRELINFGFLEREANGSSYWKKDSSEDFRKTHHKTY